MFFKGQRSHLLLCALFATIPSLLTSCAKRPAGPTNASPLQVEVTTVEQRDVTIYGDWVWDRTAISSRCFAQQSHNVSDLDLSRKRSGAFRRQLGLRIRNPWNLSPSFDSNLVPLLVPLLP